ncbi:MAG: hypothetical protein HZB26_08260 [Candidatus Hydrogenedentes bacterium]|nr:hypothetical protein [Candidatus Hydrogenedentota bacterium]
MLNVLSFKKSVFAGVLDGGESEVFLGGTKLKKFMDTVEEVSGKIPEGMPRQEVVSEGAPVEESEDIAAAETVSETAAPEDRGAQPWEELISQGLALFGKFTQALQPPADAARGQSKSLAALSPAAFIAKDERTGESFLKLPVPDSETIKGVANFLGAIANALTKS